MGTLENPFEIVDIVGFKIKAKVIYTYMYAQLSAECADPKGNSTNSNTCNFLKHAVFNCPPGHNKIIHDHRGGFRNY